MKAITITGKGQVAASEVPQPTGLCMVKRQQKLDERYRQ
jgi:hypothetical protein